MARISELHYSNAYARDSGVAEFVEVALSPGEDPADFVVSLYNTDGSHGRDIRLNEPGVTMTTDPETGENVYVLSGDQFNFLLTDPDSTVANNYEAIALTNTSTDDVLDFYDIGGGAQDILAVGGAADGAISDNLVTLTGPSKTTTTLQFNQPNPDTLTYEEVGAGDTGELACFVAGTLVRTPAGQRPIETLKAGDRVVTEDGGIQVLRWIGQTTVSGRGGFAPVRIAAGQLGAQRDIYLSPHHRVLVSDWRAQLMFGTDEVLIAARALVDDGQVQRAPCESVTYVHLLFDEHRLLKTSGLVSESFLPAAEGLNGWNSEMTEEIFALFPELRKRPNSRVLAARMICREREARVLAG